MSAPSDALPPVPPSLDAERAARLHALTTEALRAQQRQLAAGLGGALDHVPRLLRTPVRKLLGG